MSNARQILANRANAVHSTGPTTEEGKKVASQNAVKHGLLSKGSLIPGEDPAEFQQYRDNLIADLDPQGELELLLADRIVGCFWKLRRAGQLETALLEYIHEGMMNHDVHCGPPHQEYRRWLAERKKKSGHSPLHVQVKSSLDWIEQKPQTQDDYNRENLDSRMNAFARDMCQSDTMARFHKYETHLENMLFRTLNQLQRFQFLRSKSSAIPTVVENTLAAGGPIPAPANPPIPEPNVTMESNQSN
jgi:hypothetical protein